MRIFNNLTALNSYNHMNRLTESTGRTLRRLASGLRINQAADDAAGLSISEGMRGQIRGLEQSQRNIQDGISMIQTADGALGESSSILQRMRELAVQAANETYTASERGEIQKEIDQLKDQLDTISRTTSFNDKKLLDGSASILYSTSSDRLKVFARPGAGSSPYASEPAGDYRLDIQATPGTGQVRGSSIFYLRAGTLAENIDLAPAGGEYSGLRGLQAKGLAEGSYRLESREVPFGGTTYINPAGAETASPATDLGVVAVNATTSPNTVPYGEYDINVANEVPFMAAFADSQGGPDVITGVNPTGRAGIDVKVDIVSGGGGISTATSLVGNDLIASGGDGSIHIDAGPGGAVDVSTRVNNDTNLFTSFRVVGSDSRDHLISNINAVSYYRAPAGSVIGSSLTYRAQAGEMVSATASYLLNGALGSNTSRITLRVNDGVPTQTIVDVSGMNLDQAAAALEVAAGVMGYPGIDFTSLGVGTKSVNVSNGSLFSLDIIDTAGTAAAELGVAGTIGSGGALAGTAHEVNLPVFNTAVGGQDITQIAATLDGALFGAGYNIDVTAEDLGGGLQRLRLQNNTTRIRLTIDSDLAPDSAESELSLGGLNVGPGTSYSNSVYHNHTVTTGVGGLHIDQIVNQLNTAINNALSVDGMVKPAGSVVADNDNGDGTHSVWINNGTNNTGYDITFSDSVGPAAADLGISSTFVRGVDDHTSSARDFNRAIGVLNVNDSIEDIRSQVNGWGEPWLSANWNGAALTPGSDGSHHSGQLVISNTDAGADRREVVFQASAGTTQLFGGGGSVSINAGGSSSSVAWQARDAVRVTTTYQGVRSNGTAVPLTNRTDWWWEGDVGTSNPLASDPSLPFSSIYLPDSSGSVDLAGSWCLFSRARALAGYDRLDVELIDGTTGSTFVPNGGYVFNDGVLDGRSDVLLPQLIRTGPGVYTSVNHDIDFGTLSTQADAVVYSERYGAGTYNWYAHAAYGSDTTSYFAKGGVWSDYIQNVNVWRQEDDNCSLLFEVTSVGPPAVLSVQGKGYNRSGASNDFGPVSVTVSGGPVDVGCVHFDNLQLGGPLSVGDRFVINVAARAGGGYHQSPPNQSDSNISITGNPWGSGGSVMEYRFDQNAENGTNLNLLGFFVDPVNGGDDVTGVWTGNLVMQTAAGGFAAGSRVGTNPRVHLEVNYQGGTDPVAGAVVGSYYFRQAVPLEGSRDFLDSIEYDPTSVWNASVMFEVVECGSSGLVLRGQAHVYGKDGTYNYIYDEYIRLGGANSGITLFQEGAFPGLKFNRFDFANLSRLSEGDRFTLSLTANGQPSGADIDEIDLFGGADRREVFPRGWRFNEGVLDQNTTRLRTYQVSFETGQVFDSEIDLAFADFHGGTAQGVVGSKTTPRRINDTATFTMRHQEGVGMGPANHYSRLQDVTAFWNAEGRFLLEQPQQITLVSGERHATVTIYGNEEIIDVLDRINQAVYRDLGQGSFVDSSQRFKFASFTDWNQRVPGLETVEGTMVVRSAVAGNDNGIGFIGGEEILKALGFTTLREGSENQLLIDIHRAENNEILAQGIKVPGGQRLGGLIAGVELEMDSNLGIKRADYDSSTGGFDLTAAGVVSEVVHIADRRTAFQAGANENQTITLDLEDAGTGGLGLRDIRVTERESAGKAITCVDQAITRISSLRADLGAVQNRLDHTLNSLSAAVENTTSAESRIRDADVAQEMTNYVRQNILTQAAVSMLSQANLLPQMVLKLLGGSAKGSQ